MENGGDNIHSLRQDYRDFQQPGPIKWAANLFVVVTKVSMNFVLYIAEKSMF